MTIEENKMFDISVVIATRGRVHLVEKLLQSLQVAYSQFDGKYEIIIVDDSSENDARQLATICTKYNAFMLTYGPKVTAKRNYGAELAKHEIILFLDSDCVATPQLFCEHERCYHDAKVGAVLGLLEFVGPDTGFWKAIQLTPFVMPFDFPRLMGDAPWGPTANLSVKKSVFHETRGFDDTFPQKPGGEDVDFGLRVVKAGYRIQCSARALVYHTKETWIPVKPMYQRLYHWGIAECYLMDRHPDLLVPALPRKSLLYVITACLMLAMALLSGKWWLAAVFPLWVTADLFIQTTLQILWAGRSLKTLLTQFVALLLVMTNELGMVSEIVRHRRWRYLTLQMLYTPSQMEGEWYYGGSKMWANFVSILILMVLVLL